MTTDRRKSSHVKTAAKHTTRFLGFVIGFLLIPALLAILILLSTGCASYGHEPFTVEPVTHAIKCQEINEDYAICREVGLR